ncbi:hypothetical protein SETIT_7G241700v2 [Setaria italica]|uniref:Uncharacterized protein n=1 Tax=Setaria italica TaxID=4555 RepID=A0A368RZ78_SETIT|nr:hypothetical protein SETIT_7G241700v2 [Setaria italica]
MDVLGKIARAISDALQDPGKLPGALILCGVLEAAAALSLIFFRVPGGVFLHHGESYYEAAVGFWVSADPSGRRAIGKIIMGLSIPPLIVVASLGGFSSAAPK